MKILKYILFTLLGLIALVLIIALIIPKNFHAGSEIAINKPRQEVFDYVKLLRNQSNYDNWSRQDPNIQQTYSGTDGTVGFRYVWKSDKVGEGEQVITRIEEGQQMDTDLFFNGSKDVNKSILRVEELSPTQSKVIWEIDGKMPYPFNIIGLFFDMNKDFDKGLQNLKYILENE
ncbi:SRPBCC family protein [Sphingobacterium lumbrici]|uniref:SRPBCC family protein n=1 Tax=Sphingobacterium lumbrici TaxID=2559600 RepID=UPI0011279A9F|nr:SRPBCC family protein [Sphingobacterium lumbrici]